MSFPWLSCTPATRDGAARRTAVAVRELEHRAALLYRLGFTPDAATRRLTARVAWEYDPQSTRGAHRRPDALSDTAIAKLVRDTFARRPG